MPSSTTGRRQRPERNLALDALRGIAALSVLAFHAWLYARPMPPAGVPTEIADWTWSSLRVGLVLFFVLSGFLLYRAWIAAAIHGTSRPSLRIYLRRRAARVLPAYYFALLGSLALLSEAGGTPGVRLPSEHAVPLYFVFGQNFVPGALLKLDPPMWTLVVEICFYLLLPVVGLLATAVRGGRARQASVPLVLIALGLSWNWMFTPGWLASKALPAMLPYFATGMLAAVILQGRTLDQVKARIVMTAGALLVVANAVWHSNSAGTFLADLPAAAGFAAIVGAAAMSRRTFRTLERRPLVALGTISYGLYLWHVPILWWMRSRGLLPLDPLLGFAALLCPALAAATLSWFAIERPVLRLMNRARSGARRRVALAAHVP